MSTTNKLVHPQDGKTGLTFEFFGKTDSRPLWIDQELNRVFVGSPWENDNGVIEGKVHIYDLNGAYLNTISSGDESFGITVHSNSKTKRLYVGAHLSDKVYVYDTSSDYLLTKTLVGDTPGEHFGWSITSAAAYWCYEVTDPYTQEKTLTEYRHDRTWVGAPQGNVVYEYSIDVDFLRRLGPDEPDSDTWLWNYTDHHGISSANFKTGISEFGYSIHSTIAVEDVKHSNGKMTLVVGAPGSINDYGAVCMVDQYASYTTDDLVYNYYWDTYYPEDTTKIKPPFRFGEKVHSVGLYGATTNYLATLHSDVPGAESSAPIVVTNDHHNNLVAYYDADGNLIGETYSAYAYDAIHRTVSNRSGRLWATSFDDRGIKGYFWNEATQKLEQQYASPYYSSGYNPKGIDFDSDNSVIIWVASIYMFIGVDHYSPGIFQYLSMWKTYFNVRPSGSGTTRNVALHWSSKTAFVSWDRNSQMVKSISYNSLSSPVINGDVGGGLYSGEFAYGHIMVDNTHDKLYCFGFSESFSANVGLWVYDLSITPTNPPLICHIDNDVLSPFNFRTLDDDFDPIVVDEVNEILYCGGQMENDDASVINWHIWIFDVSDPNNVAHIGDIDYPLSGASELRGLDVYNNRLYVALSNANTKSAVDGTYTYDVSDPTTPVQLNFSSETNLSLNFDNQSDLTVIETESITYSDAVYRHYNYEYILPTYPQFHFANEIYAEQSFNEVRLISSPEFGNEYDQPNQGLIEYYYTDPYDDINTITGEIFDPFGKAANAFFGYSMTSAESYLAASSKGYVVLMAHPGYNLFEIYDNCENSCGLVRIYDGNSNSVPLSHEMVTVADQLGDVPKGTAELYDPNFVRDEDLVVVHLKGKIQVRGKHRFYIDPYNPTIFYEDGFHPMTYNPLMLYRFDTNDAVITDTAVGANDLPVNPYLQWNAASFNYSVGGSAEWLDPPRLSRAGVVDTGVYETQNAMVYPQWPYEEWNSLAFSMWIQLTEYTDKIKVLASNMAFPEMIHKDPWGAGLVCWIKGNRVYVGAGGGNDFTTEEANQELELNRPYHIYAYVNPGSNNMGVYVNGVLNSRYYPGGNCNTGENIVFGGIPFPNQFGMDVTDGLSNRSTCYSACVSPNGQYLMRTTLPNNFTRPGFYELKESDLINTNISNHVDDKYFVTGAGTNTLITQTFNDNRVYVTDNKKMLYCNRDGGKYEESVWVSEFGWSANVETDLSTNQFIHVEPNLHDATNKLVITDLDGTEANMTLTVGGVTVTPAGGWWTGNTFTFELLDYFLIRFSADGNRVALWSNANGNIVILNGADNTLYQTLSIAADVTNAGFTPSAKPACMGMTGTGDLLVLDQCLLLYKDSGGSYTLDSTIVPPPEFTGLLHPTLGTTSITAFDTRCAINDAGDAIIVNARDGYEPLEMIYSYEGAAWKLYRMNLPQGINHYNNGTDTVDSTLRTYKNTNGTIFTFSLVPFDQGTPPNEPIGREVFITNKDRFHYVSTRTDTTSTWNGFAYYPSYIQFSVELDLSAKNIKVDDLMVFDEQKGTSTVQAIFNWNDPKYEIDYNVYQDGIPVARKVSLFDKLTGEFHVFADSDPNNPELNKFKMGSEFFGLKFLIAFDSSDIPMDPVGIDDIYPAQITRIEEPEPVQVRPSAYFGDEYVTVTPSNGVIFTDCTTTSNVPAGFAILDDYSFTVDSIGDEVQRNVDSTDSDSYWTVDGTFSIINDVASDGTNVYVSGCDAGCSNMVVQKTDENGVSEWTKSFDQYYGSAITIAANPTGFALMCGERVEFCDPDGISQSVQSVSGIGREWALCASKDRFFIPDWSTSVTKFDVYDVSGTKHYTITPTEWPEANSNIYPVATEDKFYLFVDKNTFATPSIDQSYVVVFDRNVSRDVNGNITSDSVNMLSRVLIPINKNGAPLVDFYFYKGSVNTVSFKE